MSRKRLGELLMEAGLIDEIQLQSALGHQRQWGGRLGRVVVQMGFVKEARLVRILSQQLGVPEADPPPEDLHARVLGEVPFDFAMKHNIFPLALRRDAKGEALIIAMSDPSNVEAVDALQFQTGKKVQVAIAGDDEIEAWIRRHYQGERNLPASGPANVQHAQASQQNVQFGGQLVDLGEDDIPVVTGAIVSSPTPQPMRSPITAAPVLSPFGGAPLSQSPAPFSAPPPPSTMSPQPTLAPSFGAAPPPTAPSLPAADPFAGISLEPSPAPPEQADPFARIDLKPVAGTPTHGVGVPGVQSLDPLPAPPADGGWSAQVEAPTTPSTSPVFGPAGGFLGAGDDDEDAGPLAPEPPPPPAPAPAPAPTPALATPSAPPVAPDAHQPQATLAPSFGASPPPTPPPLAPSVAEGEAAPPPPADSAADPFAIAPATGESVAPTSSEDLPMMELDEVDVLDGVEALDDDATTGDAHVAEGANDTGAASVALAAPTFSAPEPTLPTPAPSAPNWADVLDDLPSAPPPAFAPAPPPPASDTAAAHNTAGAGDAFLDVSIDVDVGGADAVAPATHAPVNDAPADDAALSIALGPASPDEASSPGPPVGVDLVVEPPPLLVDTSQPGLATPISDPAIDVDGLAAGGPAPGDADALGIELSLVATAPRPAVDDGAVDGPADAAAIGLTLTPEMPVEAAADVSLDPPAGAPLDAADIGFELAPVSAEAPLDEKGGPPLEVPADAEAIGLALAPAEAPLDAAALGIELSPTPDAAPVEVASATSDDDVPLGGADKVPCPHCGQGIVAMARFCPFCGQSVHQPDVAASAASASQRAEDAQAEAALAAQWADAAERPLARTETDTRNTLGWVPPNREIVVVQEDTGPAPEPIAPYAPAAPAVPVPSSAPWAALQSIAPPKPAPAPDASHHLTTDVAVSDATAAGDADVIDVVEDVSAHVVDDAVNEAALQAVDEAVHDAVADADEVPAGPVVDVAAADVAVEEAVASAANVADVAGLESDAPQAPAVDPSGAPLEGVQASAAVLTSGPVGWGDLVGPETSPPALAAPRDGGALGVDISDDISDDMSIDISDDISDVVDAPLQPSANDVQGAPDEGPASAADDVAAPFTEPVQARAETPLPGPPARLTLDVGAIIDLPASAEGAPVVEDAGVNVHDAPVVEGDVLSFSGASDASVASAPVDPGASPEPFVASTVESSDESALPEPPAFFALSEPMPAEPAFTLEAPPALALVDVAGDPLPAPPPLSMPTPAGADGGAGADGVDEAGFSWDSPAAPNTDDDPFALPGPDVLGGADDPFAPPPWPSPAADDAPLPAPPPASALPPPPKLTPTMVMKLDPAEQRRLLALLLEKANVGTDVLSTPPTPATTKPEDEP
jgi:type IV pilus assembly protein PilB